MKNPPYLQLLELLPSSSPFIFLQIQVRLCFLFLHVKVATPQSTAQTKLSSQTMECVQCREALQAQVAEQ